MSTEEKQVPKVDEEKVAEKTAKTNENEEEIGSLKLWCFVILQTNFRYWSERSRGGGGGSQDSICV